MKPTDSQLTALHRLWCIANGHSGQCKIVAKFLLGLYNGTRFMFDLTDLRGLDESIFTDCMTVLHMDARHTYAEVHELLGVPSVIFEELAKDQGIKETKQRKS